METDAHAALIDVEKSLDRIRSDAMSLLLNKIGVPEKCTR